MTYYEEPHHKIHSHFKSTFKNLLLYFYTFTGIKSQSLKYQKLLCPSSPSNITSYDKIQKKPIKKQTEKEKMLWKSYFKIQTYGARKKQCLNIFNHLRVAEDVGFL